MEPAVPATDKVAAGVDVPAEQAVARLRRTSEGRPGRLPELDPRPGTPAPPKGLRRTVAHVGAEVITLDELKRAVKEKVAKLPGGYKPSREEMKQLTRQVLDMLIERRLLVQAAHGREKARADEDAHGDCRQSVARGRAAAALAGDGRGERV